MANSAGGASTPPSSSLPAGRHRRVERICSARSSDPPQALHTPAAGSRHDQRRHAPQPSASRRASPFFCSDILQDRIVEHRLRQQLLQLGVLVLKSPELAGVGHLQPAILGLPLLKGGAADPVPAADIGRRHARLLLLQQRNDLLFREPKTPHSFVCCNRRTLPSSAGIWGLRSPSTCHPE